MFWFFQSKSGKKKSTCAVSKPINELENVDIYSPNVEANLQIELINNPTVNIPESTSDIDYEIISDWSGHNYTINLQKLTCSCPDFVKNRSHFENRDPRRVCKHLYSALTGSDLILKQTDLCRVVIKAGWVASEFCTFSINRKSEIAFIYGENEWINIYVRNRNSGDAYGEYSGKFNDYGLLKSGNYWSYGRTPPGVTMIKSLLRYNELI